MKKILLLALALILALTGTAFAEGAQAKDATVTATGNGVVLVEADVATITMGVTEFTTDVREAQNTVNEKIAAIRAALVESGVDNADINTDSIYIYANYDYSGDVEYITGYTASNSLSIRTSEIDRAGEFIDIAFAAGANQLNNIQFSRQDSSEAKAQALTAATKQAMEKAKVIAEAAGLNLGGICGITEGEYSYWDGGSDFAYAREEAAAGDAKSTDVQAAMIQITASVTVKYSIAD